MTDLIARLAREYVAAYLNWHEAKDYSAKSMLRFRETRDALVRAVKGEQG